MINTARKALIMLNNLQQIHLKLLQKKVIQKTVEPNLIGKKIGDEITKVSNIFQQNNLEINKNEHDREIPKERQISPEERQKIVNDLLLI